ncbi:MAG: FHA domain-containing protein [Polyangiaceae bacterium]
MIACEVCGTDNEDKLTFCRTCGHRLKPKGGRVVAPTPATGLSAAEVPAREPEVPPDKTRCDQCGSLSPKSYRFCISCGSVLQVSSPKMGSRSSTRLGGIEEDAPRTKASEPGAPKASAPTKKAPPKQPPGPAPATVVCSECDGVCEASEAFCKYCGAPLPKRPSAPAAGAAPAAAAPAPRPAPPAAAPAPAPAPAPAAAPAPKPKPKAPPVSVKPKPAPPPSKRPAPAPAAPAKAEVTGKLVVIVEDGSEGRTLELSGRQVDIGSSEGDIILSEDRYLSGRHARFFRQDNHWYLRDLDSVNGVYRRLRKPVSLRHGDLVLLGLEVLEFQLVDHAERGLGHAIQHGVLVFGSPAATRRARLCQRTVEGVIRDVYHLVADETTIGRETGDIVFTSDPFMSRRHAAIQWDEESQEYVLVDLNSSNGTYLALRDDAQLENGDFIRLGQHLFRVDLPQRPQR